VIEDSRRIEVERLIRGVKNGNVRDLPADISSLRWVIRPVSRKIRSKICSEL
jgi:hypothetical protein